MEEGGSAFPCHWPGQGKGSLSLSHWRRYLALGERIKNDVYLEEDLKSQSKEEKVNLTGRETADA